MKIKLFVVLITFAQCFLFAGCGGGYQESTEDRMYRLAMTDVATDVERIQIEGDIRGGWLYTVEVDGCEYVIWDSERHASGTMVHKANCSNTAFHGKP